MPPCGALARKTASLPVTLVIGFAAFVPSERVKEANGSLPLSPMDTTGQCIDDALARMRMRQFPTHAVPGDSILTVQALRCCVQ
jgi:hypothetical protein